MKLFTVLMLLLTAVPAGCLPLMVMGAIGEEVKAAAGHSPGRAPQAKGTGYIFAAACLVLAVAAIFQFRRMLRQSHGEHPIGPMGLSNGTWRFVLWGAFSAGVASGVVMLIDTFDM
jgi:hypothetical protein